MTPVVRDRILGSFLVALGAALWAYIIPEGVVVPRSVQSLALSPDLWPRIVAAMFVAIGAVILLQSLVRNRFGRNHVDAADDNDEDDAPARPHGLIYVAIAAIGLFVYYALIQLLGIPVASVLAVLFYSLLYGERRYGVVAAIALIVPTALYLFFEHVAEVPIPMGIFAA